jgi:hypothetical protein
MKALFFVFIFIIATNASQYTDCVFCEYITNTTNEYVRKLFTTTDLTKYLLVNCQYFGIFSSHCFKYINSYLDIIVNYVKDDYNTDIVCDLISQCKDIYNTSLYENVVNIRNDL